MDGEKILMSGVDFEHFKGKWSAVYEYDHKEKKVVKLYDDKMEVYRIFYHKGNRIVLGTFAKEWGAIESGKFYCLKDGKMELAIDCEYSFYNAVLSDVRYGKTRSLVKNKDDVYLLTCAKNQTIIVRYDGDRLTTVFEQNGPADDFCVTGDGTIYTIAMLDRQQSRSVDNTESGCRGRTLCRKTGRARSGKTDGSLRLGAQTERL